VTAKPERAVRWIYVPSGTPSSECTDPRCRKRIWWIKTANRKRAPVNCAVEGGFEPTATMQGRGLSHFIDCPGAERFRKER